jgi:DNA-binding response OmpR family regulator
MAKILLVEDDINLREIYAARLQAEGYTVVVASDGEEALANSVKEKPDLVLLDVMMPKISGFDVLDIIRSTPETKKMKVVMLTALSQDIDRKRGEELGVDKYLVKSQITLEDVVSAVKEICDKVSNSDSGEDKKKAEAEAEDQVEETVEEFEKAPPQIKKDTREFVKEDPAKDDQATV